MTLYLILACDVDIPVFSVLRQEESVKFEWTTSGSLSDMCVCECVCAHVHWKYRWVSCIIHRSLSVPLFLSSTFLLPCHLCWALNIVCVTICLQCILQFPFAFVLRSYISVYTTLHFLVQCIFGSCNKSVCVYTISYLVVLLFDVEISVFLYRQKWWTDPTFTSVGSDAYLLNASRSFLQCVLHLLTSDILFLYLQRYIASLFFRCRHFCVPFEKYSLVPSK